jgi:hypothetical protein
MFPEYFFLGYCLEQSTERGKFKFSRADWVLLHPVNAAPFLVVMSANALQGTSVESSQVGKKRYFDFNGHRSTQVAEIESPDFRGCRFYAKAISCLYLSDKTHGGGDGELCEYRHKYGATVYLWKNRENSLYVIGGRNLRVTSRGIEY